MNTTDLMGLLRAKQKEIPAYKRKEIKDFQKVIKALESYVKIYGAW